MRNRLKKVKGHMPTVEESSYETDESVTPFLAALTNPDLLSEEESRLYPERDFDAEEVRAEYLANFNLALIHLTAKQRAVLDAMIVFEDQQKAADSLGIARSTLAVTLRQIQKKIGKLINKIQI